MAYTNRKSIHGRQLAISSSGGIISDPVGSTIASTGFGYVAQMWGPGMQISHSSTAAAISLENSGVQILSSATSTAVVATVRSAPVIGIQLQVISRSTAATVTLETGSSLLFFLSTAGESTALSMVASTLPEFPRAVTLRGISATEWVVTSKTVG